MSPLENAFEALAVESKQDDEIALLTARLDIAISALRDSILAGLNDVDLSTATLTALESIQAAVSGTVVANQGTAGSAEWPVKDVYDDGQVLADQTGDGSVKTFTFASPVELVWVESSSPANDTLVSRADPFGGTPTSSQGIPCRDQSPKPITVLTSAVEVWVPTGATVSVWGFRR